TTGGISHTGPDGSDLRQRVAAAGYNGWTNIGENLAAGQGSVAAVMDSWVKSAGHMANLIKPEFRHVGFGRQMGLLTGNTNQSWFWVQNFGASGSC
ncbi:MAG: CAP domain-containing protein, partial [Ilumatobacteraceae bacterium]